MTGHLRALAATGALLGALSAAEPKQLLFRISGRIISISQSARDHMASRRDCRLRHAPIAY